MRRLPRPYSRSTRAAAVDDALQELHQQLWAGLAIGHPCQPVLRVLPVELLKGRQQLGYVQPAIRLDVPGLGPRLMVSCVV